MSNQERKSSPLGDLQVAEKYNQETKQWEPDLYEVRDKNGSPTGEYVQKYQLKVYIADGVDEAGIGEESIVLKKDQFINARALTQFEIERLPDFLKDENGNPKVACKLSVQMNRKSYPKKDK